MAELQHVELADGSTLIYDAAATLAVDLSRRPPAPDPLRIYLDRRDWWLGYYRGRTHHYVCPLPTLVIRWRRRDA